MSQEEALNEILPYLTKIRNNCYEINYIKIINELKLCEEYRGEYIDHIIYVLLNQFKYQKDLSLKSLMILLGLIQYKYPHEKDTSYIIVKNNTVYLIEYIYVYDSYSRHTYVISDLLNKDKNMIFLICKSTDIDYYKYIFCKKIYEIMPEDLNDIQYMHIDVDFNNLRYDNVFEYDILYILYFASMFKTYVGGSDFISNVSRLIRSEKLENNFQEYLSYVSEIFKVCRFICYHDYTPSTYSNVSIINHDMLSLYSKNNSISIIQSIKSMS